MLEPREKDITGPSLTDLPVPVQKAAVNNPDHLGLALFETLVALSIVTLAAVAATSASARLAHRSRLLSAQWVLVSILREARSVAYLRNQNVDVYFDTATGTVSLVSSGMTNRSYDLGSGVSIRAVPSRGYVRFRPAGSADNSTIVLASDVTDQRMSVVVNQRGLVR
ncbi:MAG: GspH/FimT family pseudopilin [Candidatus Binatia bacterium]